MNLKIAAGNALIEMRNIHRDLIDAGTCPCSDKDGTACPLYQAIEDLEEALTR